MQVAVPPQPGHSMKVPYFVLHQQQQTSLRAHVRYLRNIVLGGSTEVTKVKHFLFVGFFDVSARCSKPKVVKPVDIPQVLAILAKHSDKGIDDEPSVDWEAASNNASGNIWLGQIEMESVLFKDGYLICPWLSAGVNKRSMNFVSELSSAMGVQVFEPGDVRFVSPDDLFG